MKRMGIGRSFAMAAVSPPCVVPSSLVNASPLILNASATAVIYTLSLHDALPISARGADAMEGAGLAARDGRMRLAAAGFVQNAAIRPRSEEHTSELQSQSNLVCRLLLEKKNQ